MKHIDVSGIKLNHIRIFLAVVKYDSFTTAAEKLHMTQPFVSKSIANLEQELGLYLFVRKNRSFQVTPAGKKLYQKWSVMLREFENSLSDAYSMQTGQTDQLKVGIGQLSQENNILIQNLEKTREMNPGLDIFVEYNHMSGLLDSLVKGLVDLIVISGHMMPAVKKMKLEHQVLLESSLSVYVPESNPLFSSDRLEFADLKREKFLAFYYENDEEYMRLLYRLAEEAGFIPAISCYVPNEMSFKANLELGNGIVLADSFCDLANRKVKGFPLDIPNNILAVWKAKNESRSLQHFLSLF